MFQDFNADGARSVGNTEPGLAGAVITVFSNDGSSASCETSADGSYGVDAPSGGFPVRLEVTLPAGAAFDGLEPGAAGPTTLLFADAPATGLDIGFNVPLDYCQDNPDLVATCFVEGDPTHPSSVAYGDKAIASVEYNYEPPQPPTLPPPPDEVAVGRDVGTTWGLGYQRSSDSFFAATVLKRHSGYGPSGLGGIYRIDLSGGVPVATPFADAMSLGIAIGTDPRAEPGEDPPGSSSPNAPGLDNLTYAMVGKVGLGDLDIEEEAGRLWLMSLGDGNLYSMDIGQDATTPTSADLFSLPSVPCVEGVFRPWAVESHRGRIYVGGVCSNEDIALYPDPPFPTFVDFPNLVGYVYSMDPSVGTFQLELMIPLNYERGCAQGQGTGSGVGCQWFPWTDLTNFDKVFLRNGVRPVHPTPILSDIEFSDGGDMLIGFTDRTGFQYGTQSPAPNSTPGDTSIESAVSGGEMLRASFDSGSNAWILESNGMAGGFAGAGTGNGEGPGGGEYFSAETQGHSEISQGGFAVLAGAEELVTSAMDPNGLFEGGLIWMADGGETPGAEVMGFTFFGQGATNLGKGVGMGDVVLRCEPAPIEIGNRVWCDLSNPGETADGVQNPGSPDVSLPGVTVDLSCDGGTVTASTVTDADGNYLFGASNVAGGIPPGVTCTVSIDASQAALGQCNLPTLLDAGGADPGSDLRDNDGADVGMNSIVEATVDVTRPGANDHSVDFGFVTAGLGAIGDTVWCDGFDGFGNGVFDPGEGLTSVTVQLFVDSNCDDVADGNPIISQSTTGDGQYLFDDLIVGLPGSELCYVVRVDPADADLGTCNQPITPVEYAPDLDTNMPLDLDNDFGFVQPLGVGSIGDTVWCDGFQGFGNGVFEAGEGVPGVEVRLFEDLDCDDAPDGAVLQTQSTAGDGRYLFANLPIGSIASPLCYVVEVDAADADLDGCNLPITPVTMMPDLDKGTPDRDDVDFGFERPCDDSDGDLVCNESCMDDRDGDGIPDCDDVDPQGYLYCEDTGEILPGGLVEVIGPGAVNLMEDGSTGRYAFVTDGTPGTYSLQVTPPQDLSMSLDCPDFGTLDPTGEPYPLHLGSGELYSSGFLTSMECVDNPFYLTFELENGDPIVINNNIPFASCEVPVVEVPTLSEWSLGVLALLLAVGGVTLMARRRIG